MSSIATDDFIPRSEDLAKDPAILQLVREQTTEWSEMVGNQLKEEWTLLKDQLNSQKDILKTLMEAAQQVQIKSLEAKFER